MWEGEPRKKKKLSPRVEVRLLSPGSIAVMGRGVPGEDCGGSGSQRKLGKNVPEKTSLAAIISYSRQFNGRRVVLSNVSC